jgi:hypothetical protein
MFHFTIKDELQYLKDNAGNGWIGMKCLKVILEKVEVTDWVLEDFINLIQYLDITESAVQVVTKMMLGAGDGVPEVRLIS